jgi:glycosyltransferase involved in cell wall biosynthesis
MSQPPATPKGPAAPGSRARVLLVTHYFPPEVGAPQARLSETAREWARAGLDVTVLTGMPNHPTGVIPPAYRGVLRRVEHVDGYRVVRTWLYATPNEGVARKTLGHLSFMVSGALLGGRLAGPADIVVVSSPTFFALGTGWLLARLRRARLVVEVRDLWPAIFVQLGVITNPRVIAVLERCELAAYRAADAVITVTEGFRTDIVRRGIPAAKVHVIPNGVDLNRFQPPAPAVPPAAQVRYALPAPGDPPAQDPRTATRASLGAGPDDVLVVYVGAHGISQGLTAVADAAALLGDAPIRFAFVGAGADKARLAAHIAQLGLTNTTLAAAVPRDEVNRVLAAADLGVVPLRAVPLFDTFVPSKMFELLAAGLPVIGAVQGEAARILTAAGAVVVAPQDPAALAVAIRSLAADGGRRVEMARAGRAYVATHFDRARLADRYHQVLLGVLGWPTGPGNPDEGPGGVPAARWARAGGPRRAATGVDEDDDPPTVPTDISGQDAPVPAVGVTP